MKIKSRFIFFVCAFALIFSLVSVSCFAYTPVFSRGDVITFDQKPSLVSISGDALTFEVDSGLEFGFEGPDGVYYVFDYISVEAESLTIMTSGTSNMIIYNGSWTFYINMVNVGVIPAPSFDVLEWSVYNPYINEWISQNTVLSSSTSFFNSLFTIISDAVFGVGASLTPEQNLSLTLISTVLSIAVVLLPVLLVLGFLLRAFRL